MTAGRDACGRSNDGDLWLAEVDYVRVGRNYDPQMASCAGVTLIAGSAARR